jgi:hydroxymethylpyrimidine pyrophosphatase-like HAD family hydrolase
MPHVVTTSSEFPLSTDSVVMFDVDATLIDEGYNITDDRIFGAVADAQDAGWVIGLNSDTPHATLVERASYFGMNGPLIAEKGAKVVNGTNIIETLPGIGEAFRTSRERIAERLAERGVVVWSGNPAEVLNGSLGRPGDPVLIVNDRREFGMSFYFRRITDDGTMEQDADLTDELVAAMTPDMPQFDDLEYDRNYNYGILIVNRRGITKRLGTQALLTNMGLDQIAMVGNSRADYVGDGLAVHYAVGNADPDFRQMADYVSSLPLTSGCVEILQHMAASRQ